MSERDEMLDSQMAELEEETKKLAERMQELVGIDCNSGACVFDPALNDVEAKIEEVQKRKKTLEKIKDALDSCEA